MLEYRYDGTFSGFLTSVFDAFSRKEQPDAILPPESQGLLFAEVHRVDTNPEQSERVWAGIRKTGGDLTGEHLYYAFLSREEGVETVLLRYCQHLFNCRQPVMTDLGNSDVLTVHKLYRKVAREAHRVLMFLRFEQAADGTYFAPYAPKYDVVPLVAGHFKARFADQSWIIYDTRRDYGICFNAKDGHIDRFSFEAPAFNAADGKLNPGIEHPDEDNWQALWRAYFKGTAIAERKNPTLQMNFMPKRFWKYLTEKRI
ncbi:MAG: TIGR03915 family putative DNA repair protein [Breznakibacter sp.]